MTDRNLPHRRRMKGHEIPILGPHMEWRTPQPRRRQTRAPQQDLVFFRVDPLELFGASQRHRDVAVVLGTVCARSPHVRLRETSRTTVVPSAQLSLWASRSASGAT